MEGPSIPHLMTNNTIANSLHTLQDEAYELGQQWAKLYDPDTPSRKLISELMDASILVNVVHNEFKDPEAIFRPFYKAGAEYAAGKQSVMVNGRH